MKRILIFFIAVIMLFGLLGFVISRFYAGEVKEVIIKEINKRLSVKIMVKDIEFSVFRNFPNASVSVTGIETGGINAHNQPPLIKAGRFSFLFDITDVLKGTYTIKKIVLEDAFLNIIIFSGEKNNFSIFKNDSGGGNVKIELKKIFLRNVQVAYVDYRTGSEYLFRVNRGVINAEFSARNYIMNVSADMITDYLKNGNVTFLSGKKIALEALFDIDNEKNIFKIIKGRIKMNGLSFKVEGSIAGNDLYKTLNIRVQGKKSTLSRYLKEIPEVYLKPLEDFAFNGDITFTAMINGKIGKSRFPEIIFKFDIDDGSIKYKPNGFYLRNASFKGIFDNGKSGDRKNYSLQITGFSATTQTGKINGDISVHGFTKPVISISFSVQVKANEIVELLDIDTLKSVSGDISIDMELKKKLNSFSRFTVNDFISGKNSGTLVLENFNFRVKNSLLTFNDFNGHFVFNNKDLIAKNFNGKISKSDFKLKGKFINILPYFLLSGNGFNIDATVVSSMIDFDELLQHTVSDTDTSYRLRIPATMRVNLDLDIKKMKFRKFKAEEFKGRLKLLNGKILVNNASFASMDGRTTIEGVIDGSRKEKIIVECKAGINNVDISKLFYEFGDFGQDNLTWQNLRGNVTASVTYKSAFDNSLKIFPESITAYGDITVEDGELVHYAPLYKLGKILKNKDLQHIRFSTLKNRISIKNRVINIPEMQILSNTLNLSLNGTHTFDNIIDYHVWILLSELLSKKKKDVLKSEIEDIIIKDDGLGHTSIALHITGTVDEPEISYDKNAIKQKIKQNFKKEKENIKEVFRKEFNLGSKRDTATTVVKDDGTPDFIIDWDSRDSMLNDEKPSNKGRRIDKEKPEDVPQENDFIIEWEDDTLSYRPGFLF